MAINTQEVIDAIESLISQGHSEEEAAQMVAKALTQHQSIANAPQRIMNKRDDKAMADYWQKHISNKTYWFPDDILEAERMAKAVNENGLTREEQFKANMRAKNAGNQISMLRDSKAAREFFRKK